MTKGLNFLGYLDRHQKQILELMGLSQAHENIEKAILLIIDELRVGKTLLVFGNGGSASDALHITAELVGKFMFDRAPINAICLNANTSILTAWPNDNHFKNVFSRQIEAFSFGQAIVLGISTSGKSENVIKAMRTAKSRGHKTISLVGAYDTKLREDSDVVISVPTHITRDTQELHVLVYHYLCERIEYLLKAEG